MKKSCIYRIVSLSLVIIFYFITPVLVAQEKNVEPAIQKKAYSFVVQQVSPLRGPNIQMTSYYEVKISGDTMRVDLPYFGRAFSAPIDPRQGGFNFTSTSFDYKIKKRRKAGWSINIRPMDHRDVQELNMTVFKNGTATLRVISNNRQAISYQGFVKENDERQAF